MENIVIELSRYTTDDLESNSVWTNHLSKPISIDVGDEIVCKQCFIDTRLIDSTSILIDRDVEWSLNFIYWITGHGINQFTNSGTDLIASVPDGLPYCLATAWNPTKNGYTPLYTYPLTDKFTIKIPAGTYERSYLAEFITKQFESVRQPQLTALSDLRWGNCQVFPKFTGGVGSSASGYEEFNSIEGSDKIVTSFQKPLLLAKLDTGVGIIGLPYFYFYADTSGNYRPAVLNQMVNYINGAYSNDSGEMVTQIKNAQVGTMSIDDEEYILYDGGYIGCSEMAFVYSDQNSGKFSFQYCHTPLTNGGNEVVGNYIQKIGSPNENLNNNVSWFGAYSGILFTDTYTNLTPQDSSGNYLYDQDPFFAQIGMKYNDIVSTDANNLFINAGLVGDVQTVQQGVMHHDLFLSHTTKNFYGISALSDPSVTTTIGNYKIASNQTLYSLYTVDDDRKYCFSESQITDEIYMTNVPISSDTNAGHYLVELITCYDNQYINDDANYQIKAIVGNFYLSGDSFTMSMGPDSISYQHQGIPLSLSSVKVRILNPVTKLPAENVGINSTIYLQVFKAKPQDTTNDK